MYTLKLKVTTTTNSVELVTNQVIEDSSLYRCFTRYYKEYVNRYSCCPNVRFELNETKDICTKYDRWLSNAKKGGKL